MNVNMQRCDTLLSYVYDKYRADTFLPADLESELGFTTDEMTKAANCLVDSRWAKQITFGGMMQLTDSGRYRAVHTLARQ